jgi:hypothetical protein
MIVKLVALLAFVTGGLPLQLTAGEPHRAILPGQESEIQQLFVLDESESECELRRISVERYSIRAEYLCNQQHTSVDLWHVEDRPTASIVEGQLVLLLPDDSTLPERLVQRLRQRMATTGQSLRWATVNHPRPRASNPQQESLPTRPETILSISRTERSVGLRLITLLLLLFFPSALRPLFRVLRSRRSALSTNGSARGNPP